MGMNPNDIFIDNKERVEVNQDGTSRRESGSLREAERANFEQWQLDIFIKFSNRCLIRSIANR